jgi:membrane-associated protease RseP (regulator of RpoE activity)
MSSARRPPPPTRREWTRFVAFFVATLVSVFLSYGWWWSGGDPLSDPKAFRDSAMFAVGLMGILGAHEAGHYIVARRHGMDQTLPFFIPFPLAFGTLGAIIRLRTPPRTRSALLALGLPGTVEHAVPEVVMQWPPPEPEAPGAVAGALLGVLNALASLLPEGEPVQGLPLTIMANPPVMDVIGFIVQGNAPGRYAELTPLGLAGWAGCFLTAMNLLPIGQLDGGHVLRAVAPKLAERVAPIGLLVVGLAGLVFWQGWTVWAVLLWLLGAWRGLPARDLEPPTFRARVIAGLTAITWGLCFMPNPIEPETIAWQDVRVIDQNGNEVPTEAVEAWWSGTKDGG